MAGGPHRRKTRRIHEACTRIREQCHGAGELLIRGNQGSQTTSKLTAVVDETYTTASMSVPGANYGLSSAQREHLLSGP